MHMNMHVHVHVHVHIHIHMHRSMSPYGDTSPVLVKLALAPHLPHFALYNDDTSNPSDTFYHHSKKGALKAPDGVPSGSGTKTLFSETSRVETNL